MMTCFQLWSEVTVTWALSLSLSLPLQIYWMAGNHWFQISLPFKDRYVSGSALAENCVSPLRKLALLNRVDVKVASWDFMVSWYIHIYEKRPILSEISQYFAQTSLTCIIRGTTELRIQFYLSEHTFSSTYKLISLVSSGYLGLFFRLTTHLHFVSSGAIPPLHQYVFMAWCLIKQWIGLHGVVLG
jgi:hypothetical protein